MIENVSVVIEKISATLAGCQCHTLHCTGEVSETEADEWVGNNTAGRGDSNVTSLVPAKHQGVIQDQPSPSNNIFNCVIFQSPSLWLIKDHKCDFILCNRRISDDHNRAFTHSSDFCHSLIEMMMMIMICLNCLSSVMEISNLQFCDATDDNFKQSNVNLPGNWSKANRNPE